MGTQILFKKHEIKYGLCSRVFHGGINIMSHNQEVQANLTNASLSKNNEKQHIAIYGSGFSILIQYAGLNDEKEIKKQLEQDYKDLYNAIKFINGIR